MINKKLRVGIMCQGNHLPRWQRVCIEKMLAQGNVEISLLIMDVPANYPQRSFMQKVKDTGFKNLLFVLYLKLFYRPVSIQSCDMNDIFAHVPQLNCVVHKKGKYSQYFSKEDIETIRGYDLDIMLRFGFNIIRGEILKAARYGVWSFHHDDEQRYRGGPPCFWEIYHRDPETGSILQRLTEKLDAGVILKKGIFRTKSHSYARNIDQAYLESAKWPAMVCNDIINGNAAYVDGAPAVTQAPIYKYPGNLQFIRFIFLLTANKFEKLWARLFVMQQWNVGLIKANPDDFVKNPAGSPVTFLKHRNTKSFNADCFGLRDQDDVHVLYEEMDYVGMRKGQIMYTRIDKSGAEHDRAEVTSLGIDVHASYPFLFKDNGSLYMIPETGASRQVVLYEAEVAASLKNWKKKSVLLNGEAFADTTMFKHNGKYWLFFTLHNQDFDVDLHLHIAYADTLNGPFTMHPKNPVKISARSARPAGNIYKNQNGDWIRPAQNFSKTYGGSIVLNRIDLLDENNFEETEIHELKPFDAYYKHGLHTLNVIDEQTVLVDMKRHAFRFLLRQ